MEQLKHNVQSSTGTSPAAVSAAETSAAPDIRKEQPTDAAATDVDEANAASDAPATDTLAAADTVPTSRYADAAEIFGDASTVVAEPAVAVVSYGGRSDSGIFARSIDNTVAGDPIFQSLLLATLIVCIAVSTRYKREIASLTGKMFGGRLSDDYAEGRRHEIIPKQFMDTSILFGIFVISLIVVRYVDAWLPERVQAIGGDIVPFSVLRVLGVMALCIAYQYTVLKIIGFVSRETEFVDALVHIKRAAFAVSTVILAPVFVLAALSVGRSAEVWMLALAVICAVLVLLFVKETLVLFIGKKVPFLHWILYLCTVEAFPLTLVCASIARCQ